MGSCPGAQPRLRGRLNQEVLSARMAHLPRGLDQVPCAAVALSILERAVMGSCPGVSAGREVSDWNELKE